jgi:hypothetical protein
MTTPSGPDHFIFEIGVNAMSHGSIAHLLRGQPPALRLLELLASLVEIFDLDTSPWLDAEFALLES